MSRFYTDFKGQAQQTIDEWTSVIEGALYVFSEAKMAEKAEKALEVIEKKSQEYVPEDTGRLKGSWFSRVEVRGGEVEMIFGYDENNQLDYAWFVYINPTGMVFQKEGARDHWLEEALQEVMPEVLQILSS